MYKAGPVGNRIRDRGTGDPADDTPEQVPVPGAPRRIQVGDA